MAFHLVMWCADAPRAAEPQAAVHIERDDAAGRLRFVSGDRELLVYRYGAELEQPYIWPLRSPEGHSMTIEHPTPYPHHRSVWFADRIALGDAAPVDFYHSTKNRDGQGDDARYRHRIRHVEFVGTGSSAGRAFFREHVVWEHDGRDPWLDGRRDLSLVDLGSGEYLLDLKYTVTASYGDVKFCSDAVHYAWPYVRMDPSYAVLEGGRITSSDGGIDQKGTNGREARWIDYSGTVDGATAGLAILSHTDNPQPHSWLTRDYGTFGPRRVGALSGKPFTLKRGESLRRRVGLLVHRGDVAAGKVAKRYAAYSRGDFDAPSGFRFVEVDGGGLRLLDGELPVFTYLWKDQLAKGVPENRRRSSYIHPIHGLDGELLTDDFPKDHYHHRGLSLMWPRMEVRGKKVQIWHIEGIHTRFRAWDERHASDEVARLRVKNVWQLDNGDEVATELLGLRVWHADEAGRAIDVQYSLAAKEPIVLQGAAGKGYGGLNLRLARAKDSVLTTDTESNTRDSDRKPQRWADYSARFAGRESRSGIAIFVAPSHPGKTRGAPPWTTRHYGILNVAWPGLEKFTLEPDKPITLSYRLWIHRGDVTAGQVEKAFREYVKSTEKAAASG